MPNNFRSSTIDEDLHSWDPLIHARTVISAPHRMTHDGFMFHASTKVTGMVDANVDDILIDTGLPHPHLQRLSFDFGSGDVDVLMYEGATTSADGTAIPVVNTNRNSIHSNVTNIFTGPTVTGTGALLHTTWSPPTGVAIGQRPVGIAGIELGEEWVLKPSTKYLARIINNSGETIDYRWEMVFYEVDYDT